MKTADIEALLEVLEKVRMEVILIELGRTKRNSSKDSEQLTFMMLDALKKARERLRACPMDEHSEQLLRTVMDVMRLAGHIAEVDGKQAALRWIDRQWRLIGEECKVEARPRLPRDAALSTPVS